MKQYELWWADLPAPAGRRPVLLLTRTPALGYLNRVVVVEVTRTVRGIPQEVAIGPADGLATACVANLDALISVPKSRLTVRIGVLRTSQWQAVKKALGYALDWVELKAV